MTIPNGQRMLHEIQQGNESVGCPVTFHTTEAQVLVSLAYRMAPSACNILTQLVIMLHPCAVVSKIAMSVFE